MPVQSKLTIMKLVLDGEVFARRQLFTTLSSDLQEDTKQFRTYVEQDTTRLFQAQFAALLSLKIVLSVTGRELVDAIIQWLKARSPSAENASVQSDKSAKSALTLAFSAANAGQSWEDVAEAAPDRGSGSTTTRELPKEELAHAKKIAEALVLSGFLTPYKENETHLSFIAPDHYVQDDVLLIPIASSVADCSPSSVWNVVDGAVYARNLKRKAGLLGSFSSHGKDVYVVVNAKTKKLYLFASDVAREPIAELSGATLDVQLDNSHFDFGVCVAQDVGREKDKPELFNAETTSVQTEFLNACLSIGATYEGGDAKKRMEAEKRGLIIREAVAELEKKTMGLTTDPRDVAMATATAASISGLASEGRSEHQQTNSTDKAPMLTPVDAMDKDSNCSAKPKHYSSNKISSLAEKEPQHVGTLATAVKHHDRLAGNAFNSPVLHEHHGIFYPDPSEHGGQVEVGAKSASKERQGRHERKSGATSGDAHDRIPSVGERLNSTIQDDISYLTSPSEYHSQPQHQSARSYPTSSEHQKHVLDKSSHSLEEEIQPASPYSSPEKSQHHSSLYDEIPLGAPLSSKRFDQLVGTRFVPHQVP